MFKRVITRAIIAHFIVFSKLQNAVLSNSTSAESIQQTQKRKSTYPGTTNSLVNGNDKRTVLEIHQEHYFSHKAI